MAHLCCGTLLAFTLTLSAVGLAGGASCRDGWGRTGVCINLRSCTEIVQLAQSKPSKEDIVLIRRSICPSPNRGVFVCCVPPTPPPPNTTTTTTTTTTTAPLDLSQFDPTTPEGSKKRLLLPRSPKCGHILSERIVGGEEAAVGEFPWLALLGFEEEEEDAYSGYDYGYDDAEAVESTAPANITFRCGGTLISERYVVTAAHCIPRPGNGKIVTIRLGEHNLDTEVDCQVSPITNKTTVCNEPPVDIAVERVITHRQFNKPFKNKNDIALIRLAQPVNFTKLVAPICLPFEEWRTRKLPNDESIVAGFGLTQAYINPSRTMQKLKVPMVNRTSCREKYASLRTNIGRGQICAGGTIGQDSCEGDSGGPLIMHGKYGPPFYLVGITSLGQPGCGKDDTPGVYTKVGDYVGWILDKMTF